MMLNEKRNIWKGSPVVFVSTGLLAVVFFAAAIQFWFGSLLNATRWIQGERVFIENSYVDIGAQPAGSNTQVEFIIRNLTPGTIRLSRSTSSCSCLSIPSKLEEIPPWSCRKISIAIALGSQLGNYSQRFSLIATAAETEEFRVLSGEVAWILDSAN